MSDPTESIRRQLVQDINSDPSSDRRDAEQRHGQVWDSDELRRDFEVVGFLAPFVMVRRRSDGKKGSLMFQHSPRFYYAFEAAIKQ